MSVRICLVPCPAMYRQAGEEISFCQPTLPLSCPLPIPALGMLLLLSQGISAGLKANPIPSGSHPHQGGRSANKTLPKKTLITPLVWLVFPLEPEFPSLIQDLVRGYNQQRRSARAAHSPPSLWVLAVSSQQHRSTAPLIGAFCC